MRGSRRIWSASISPIAEDIRRAALRPCAARRLPATSRTHAARTGVSLVRGRGAMFSKRIDVAVGATVERDGFAFTALSLPRAAGGGRRVARYKSALFPSPLWGGVRGGVRRLSTTEQQTPHPLPNPPLKGGGSAPSLGTSPVAPPPVRFRPSATIFFPTASISSSVRLVRAAARSPRWRSTSCPDRCPCLRRRRTPSRS